MRLFDLGKIVAAVTLVVGLLAGCSQRVTEPLSVGAAQNAIDKASAEITTTAGTKVAAENLLLSEIVYFDLDSAELSPTAKAALDEVVKTMSINPAKRLVVGGHTDERGTRSYNLALGARRAASVADYLLAQGINEIRIKQISYGKEKPLLRESTEEAWQKNRRAELNGE